MELLQPGTWQEALEARAAHPGALPLWGGTDVMVDLNFGRERPEAILDLTRVARAGRVGGARRRPARRRRGHLRARDRRAGRPAARPGRRLAHRRLAPDPQPRHDRRQPRLLLPRRRRAAAAVREPTRRSSWPPRAGTRRVPIADFITGPKRNVLGRRRADRRLPRAPRRRAAAVLQGRHPQRDGDRGLLVRARASTPRSGGSAPASARPAPTPLPRAEAEAFAAGALDWDGATPADRRRRCARFGELVAQAAQPIDDVRGSAAYRRHALSVLARRTLGWAWSEQCA